MMRNLDYRIEATTPIYDMDIKEELKQILEIQLAENEKARVLDNEQVNQYVPRGPREKHTRSQVEIYKYLKNKTYL